jgi:hypothetical protein
MLENGRFHTCFAQENQPPVDKGFLLILAIARAAINGFSVPGGDDLGLWVCGSGRKTDSTKNPLNAVAKFKFARFSIRKRTPARFIGALSSTRTHRQTSG